MPSARAQEGSLALYTDASEATAGTLAAEAEAFVARVSERLGVGRPGVTVYVFKNAWNLRLFLRRECPQFSNRTGACFRADDGRLLVALRAVGDGRPTPRSLRHELTHAVVASNCGEPMPWLDEGLAQVFENDCPPRGDPDRLARLRRRAGGLEDDLERLLSAGRHESLTGADYLLAWGVVWSLLHEGPEGADAIRRCLQPPVFGEGPLNRAVRGLGKSPTQLAAELTRFLNGPN